MPGRLISRPIVPDLENHISPVQKIQNEIKALAKLLPTERELEFLAHSHTQADLAQVRMVSQSICERIASLEKERLQLLREHHKDEPLKLQRSLCLQRERQDDIVMELVCKEAAALERLESRAEESEERVAEHRRQAEARHFFAQEIRERLQQDRLEKLLGKQANWRLRMCDLDRLKYEEAQRRAR
ncbi:MAG: hypothetical protein QXW10_04660, partial [Candidatus Micrarchaeaceae archaeon]